MISIILYGRNDNYGYNVHKRAAISLNCFAEVLTHPDDEILFVDCNTPDELPTFPEAIKDTLTEKARRLLRIFRLRPALYDRVKGESHLKALEPISRNIAIRRSNPANRWVLSTNTDMVFVPRLAGRSLSDIAAEAPDGFYELPRFEVPEVLWETVDRLDPASIIAKFKHWGTRLHLNEVVHAQPFILYDGPGDFQLVLRRHLFEIHGFNEAMVLGWHVDSNLCKRLHLHQGETLSLLEALYGYHCDHTRIATPAHGIGRKENNMETFIRNVETPFIVEQAEKWGLPGERIEEIRLTDAFCRRYEAVLEAILPGATQEYLTTGYTKEYYCADLLYAIEHAFPYLADHLVTIPPQASVAYFGGNAGLLEKLAAFRKGYAHERGLGFDPLLFALATPQVALPSHEGLIPIQAARLIKQAELFIFDFGLQTLPTTLSENEVRVPEKSAPTSFYCVKLFKAFADAVKAEARRLAAGARPRKFLMVGITNTVFEPIIGKAIGLHAVPYSCHVKHGYLLDNPDIEALDVAAGCFARAGLYFGSIILFRCRQLSEEFGIPFTEDDYERLDSRVASMQQRVITAEDDVAGYARQVLDMGLGRLDVALMRLHAQLSLAQGMADSCAVQLALHDLWLQILNGEIVPLPPSPSPKPEDDGPAAS